MADLEGGRTVPMLCSTLTMAFSTVAAALLIAVVPAVSGASYLQPDFAPQMALLTADTSRPELPSMISIGMARICYKSPGITCLPWSPGLVIDPVSFEGAAKWQHVLPGIILTQIWAGLSILACLLTLATAFTSFCKGAPAGARWGFLLLAVLSNGAYFIVTAILFFLLRDRIESGTEYAPKAVVVTAIIYLVPLGMLLLIPIITFFLPMSEYATGHSSSGDIIINAKNPRLEELMLRMEAMLGRIDPNAGKVGEDGTEKVGEDGLTESRRKKFTAKILAQLQKQLARLNKEAPDLNARRAKHNAETAHVSDTVKEATVIRQIDLIKKLQSIGMTPEDAKRQLRRRKMLEAAASQPAQRQAQPDVKAQMNTNAPPVPPKKPIKRKKPLEGSIPPAMSPFQARPAPTPQVQAHSQPQPPSKPQLQSQPPLRAASPAQVVRTPAVQPRAIPSKAARFQKAAHLARAATQAKQKPGNKMAAIAAAAALGAPAAPNPHDEVVEVQDLVPAVKGLDIAREPRPEVEIPARRPLPPKRSQTTPMPAARETERRPVPQKAPTAVYPTQNALNATADISAQRDQPVRTPSPVNIPLPNSLPDIPLAPSLPSVPTTEPIASNNGKAEDQQKKHESVAMAWK